MISYLLLEPVLSYGEGGAAEAVISAAIERINRTDGSVSHEETIGDYASFQNRQDGIQSAAPRYDYKMIDTDFFLPIVMKSYLIDNGIGRARKEAFLSTKAKIDPSNEGLTYADLATINAEKIMNITAAFAEPGGQIQRNLIHLKDGEILGQWRDSEYGIGGGRIPYDVNTALVPAALRSIALLSAANLFPMYPIWNETASKNAVLWEDHTLKFFEVVVPSGEARDLVNQYTRTADRGFPSKVEEIKSDVMYHGLALESNNNQSIVKVMNTDDWYEFYCLPNTAPPNN